MRGEEGGDPVVLQEGGGPVVLQEGGGRVVLDEGGGPVSAPRASVGEPAALQGPGTGGALQERRLSR